MDKTTYFSKCGKLIGKFIYYKNLKSISAILCCGLLFVGLNTYAQTTIDFSDFETGTQGWTLGNDAGLNSSSTWACAGNNSIFVEDDKASSSATSSSYDLSPYTSITISFCFKGSTKIDDGEGFDLEYFDGSSWILLKSYRRGTEFTDIGSSETYNYNYPMLSSDYNFATNAQFRFLGKSSKGDEICYFDNILIEETPIFFDGDSDGDGINDSIDIDDDNDGILDTIECSVIVNPPLLNADFEDLDILTLDGGPTDVVPTTGIWKGDASNIPNWESADPTNNYLEIWHNSQAAGNDAGGQAFSGTHWAEVNATTNDGLYQDVVSTPGDILQWTFAHRKRTGYAGSSNEDVLQLLIGDTSGNLVSQGNFVSAGDSSWTNYSGTYIVPAGQTTTRLTFSVLSTASGSTSSGNFIDNVQLFVIPTNCTDTDGDSIPDYFDLDSDNDGIPDIVEAGNGSISAGTGIIPLASFTDTNQNGMHDPFETSVPIDSDGDGTPNYLDLDSDNDAVFDVDEARIERTVFGQLVHENGDGDINGDGVGDGVESEAFRAKDSDNDGVLEYFGDGILDIYDYGTGANEYGNLNQGSGPYFVKNEDNADTPDYIDLDSNNDGIYDIAETLYADLDANNDGIIDDTNDADGDGLVDVFDTNDTQRGSPRDLNTKLHLYFDGRNDYAEDTNVINGWSEATLMGWIKIDPAASGDQVIMGQDVFYLQLNSNKSITAKANGYTVNTGSALNTNQWTHIAATYSNTNSLLKVFINGQEITSTAVSGSLPADTSSLTLGRLPDNDSKYFNGYLDEVRVFFKALTNNELQKMVYQEIEDNGGTARGVEIPKDITDFVNKNTVNPLIWTNLKRYYRLDAYKGDIIDDLTTPAIDTGSGAKIYNTKLIDIQSAPLPFVTQQSGSLEVAVNDPDRGINGSDAVNYDYSIVKIQHDDVTFNGTQKHVGLIIDELDASSNPIKFRVTNDSELNVSWYLKLDGLIDLEGESQLIQGLDSELDVTSKGKIERDQQGTADTYTYNYWSTPVGVSSITSNNNNFTLPDIMRDGTQNINFLSSGYDGTNTSPIGIADYWIWKFANQLDDDYSSWQHVRSTGTIMPGEGFTMKGPGTGTISAEQNYVFLGKPNNGDINLTLNAGNDYLVGNPYASAIDAHQFILDNGPLINGSGPTTGTLFFWEHWGGGSHNLTEYLGGYATYNLSGGVPAASMGSNDPGVGTGGLPTKTPGRYIPISQGFFVVAETSGTLNFNNGQRVFQRESANSVFMEANPIGNETIGFGKSADQQNDESYTELRPQIRIGFNSVNTIRRQLLLTVDENASDSIDWGYDGRLYEIQIDDLVWLIEDEKFTIQGVGFLDEQTILPLGLNTASEGINSIALDAKLNTPDDCEIYVHDKELDIYHDLEDGDYEFYSLAGENLERFEIVFSPGALGVDENELSALDIHFSNELESIVLINPTYKDIRSINMFDVQGKSIFETQDLSNSDYAEYKVNNLSTGTYVLQIISENGGIISKKVLVE
ncbi:MAG: T9SS type A sorting domain-containing protein [Bacteroidia bacterium]|nr:T9SS type A sorting domain-containing protein [Bacteroidia bacterium]MBT8279858.1 T9SS type A sorting domain-containing protein [Bacteroidia bacterium]NND24956.1 T9SS type A sorting domain-containing protein [Flavobacteriaceae bacterium]NNK59325.1 T9SS type A sorting domain-containing protein [Flavobacteriaceae bacterium]